MGSPAAPHRIAMTPGARRALEAASRLFYERGIHAVGVDLIAAEAGVTKKTLYDRFGSKEQLVVEYLAARDEGWRAFLAERLDTAGPSAAERVLAVFDASRDWADEHSTRGCSMVNAHAEISDPHHPAYAIITGQKAWMLGLFTDLVREGAPEGEADPAPRPEDPEPEADPDLEAGPWPEADPEPEADRARAETLGRALMLLHEGALVAHGLNVFPTPLHAAREQARLLLAAR
ncbi:TetR family transcriptional regulator [Streptomyces sp. NBC_01142]|uniref:TetR family transcriptional regulator n=1 Tax=Streptomyces sp. NBC_01142 TaxID=2975865 RepID=UPI00225BB6DC|nr:TetR family transcriptional regulator [Streptomyces sp. NBC_01142]MCX4819306.1 TetR family transcriptional regulator [Streptomyces sp. NBC_01142]